MTLSALALWVGVALILSILLVIWRVWPVLKGRARPGEPLEARAHRWNRYIRPLFQKTMGDKMLVAQAVVFESQTDGQRHAMATWSLEPSVLPDVEFVALATPEQEGEKVTARVVAVAPLKELRAALGGGFQSQTLFGHELWICVWPEGVALESILPRLSPVETFRARHASTPLSAKPDA